MKKILAILLLVMLSGCYLNRSEMYQARGAFYEAQAEAYEAYIDTVAAPLVVFTTPGGDKFVVNNPTPQPLPTFAQERNAWVDFSKAFLNSTPLSILAGGWSVRELFKHSTGDVTINGDGNTASPISHSYNSKTTDIATATDGGSLDQHVDNSDSSNNSDNSDSRSDYDNQTATPTVVTQPRPIVVDPVVVNPVVVQVGDGS